MTTKQFNNYTPGSLVVPAHTISSPYGIHNIGLVVATLMPDTRDLSYVDILWSDGMLQVKVWVALLNQVSP